jgi:hypothetical protein
MGFAGIGRETTPRRGIKDIPPGVKEYNHGSRRGCGWTGAISGNGWSADRINEYKNTEMDD